MIAAVRRDLFGPSPEDPDLWPDATVKVLAGSGDPIAVLDSHRDLIGMVQDADGNEILHGSPLRRYGVGVLYPEMRETQHQQLDAAQADEAAAEDDPTGPDSLDPDPVVAGDADIDDAADEPGDIRRPRSMAVSFMTAQNNGETLKVTVSGGRYESVTAIVAGNPTTLWRRQPVTLDATFLAFDDGRRQLELTAGPLTIRVGASYRSHADGCIVTVYVLNASRPISGDLRGVTGVALFQTTLTIEAGRGLVVDYPRNDALAGEDQSLELLYHTHPVRAIGHGCNARHSNGLTDRIVGEHFPIETVHTAVPVARDQDGQELDVDMDALGRWAPEALTDIDRLLDEYGAWIDARRQDIPSLKPGLTTAATAHVIACEEFLAAARRGWKEAHDRVDIRQTLQWTSKAMADQRRAYGATTRPLAFDGRRQVTRAEGPSPHDVPAQARWRGFQIAFLLASIPPTVDPSHPDRDRLDIIWLATGGGKTEAYSAVAAFTMLWLRQTHPAASASGAGVTVLMRYTLRLLTAQQLQRASSLICALEQLRRRHEDVLGKKRFTIGAWLGKASTPNNREDACRMLNKWSKQYGERAFLLSRCPWCAAAIGKRDGTNDHAVDGYQIQPTKDGTRRVQAYCPDPACPFNVAKQPFGLPVYEVDEDLYAQPPSFLVGTIDKFAMFAWRTDPSSFFGLRAGKRVGPGPALLIQDELHLISGPLGSLDALYEPVIEDLCVRDGGSRPRLVAATATTRRYREQGAALYDRDNVRLIPPPGFDADDNFFASTNSSGPGKIFVGICAPGYGKAQETQVRLLAALSHAAGSIDATGTNADPWWTNLCFFSSRRALGLALSLCQTHLRGHTWRLHRVTGAHAGRPRQSTGTRTAQRHMQRRIELTAQATSDVTEAMDRLSIGYTDNGAVDLCFATSMIEVGVDIDRLGLLTIFGQPKSASQYIQVAGRVGRQTRTAPGVVFVLLSPYNTRDRSHFEQFSTFHQRLYSSVEPVSITPYTPAALERGLAGALTAWLRQALPSVLPPVSSELLAQAVAPLRRRAAIASGTSLSNLEHQLAQLTADMHATKHETWGRLQPRQTPDGFLYPLGDDDDPLRPTTVWVVPTSMRSVDAESGARTVQYIGANQTRREPDDDDDEHVKEDEF